MRQRERERDRERVHCCKLGDEMALLLQPERAKFGIRALLVFLGSSASETAHQMQGSSSTSPHDRRNQLEISLLPRCDAHPLICKSFDPSLARIFAEWFHFHEAVALHLPVYLLILRSTTHGLSTNPTFYMVSASILATRGQQHGSYNLCGEEK